MLKKIVINIVIGGVLFLFGALLHDLADIRRLGNSIAYAGIAYVFVSVIIILLSKNPPSFFVKKIKEKEKNKAHSEMLKHKKLFDEGLLTRNEFYDKTKDLKNKI